jgi:hypothetical protein
MQVTVKTSLPTVRREGGTYEFIGFLMILASMAGCCISISTDSGVGFSIFLMVAGFVVFLIGRFK